MTAVIAATALRLRCDCAATALRLRCDCAATALRLPAEATYEHMALLGISAADKYR